MNAKTFYIDLKEIKYLTDPELSFTAMYNNAEDYTIHWDGIKSFGIFLISSKTKMCEHFVFNFFIANKNYFVSLSGPFTLDQNQFSASILELNFKPILLKYKQNVLEQFHLYGTKHPITR